MKRVLISIPGVPNGYSSLSSKAYHNPYPFLDVVREVYSDVDYEAFIWVEEVSHPWGNWTRWIPGLSIPLFYFSYLKMPHYRKLILDKFVSRLTKLYEVYDEIYILSHSHGNRVAFDAMSRLDPKCLSKFVWVSQAPAFNGVLFGALPTSVGFDALKKIRSKLKSASFYRIRGDLLSGTPNLEENIFLFPSNWYELCLVAHANVRSRKDIVKHFKNFCLRI